MVYIHYDELKCDFRYLDITLELDIMNSDHINIHSRSCQNVEISIFSIYRLFQYSPSAEKLDSNLVELPIYLTENMALFRREGSVTIHSSPWKPAKTHFNGNIAEFVLTSPAWASNPDDPIYIDSLDSNKVISSRDIKTALGKFAYLLQTKYDIQEGDVVCLLLLNSIYLPALHLGILAAGGIVSPASTAYLPNELHHQLNLSGAKIIITQDEFIDTARKAVSPETASELKKPLGNFDSIVTLTDLLTEVQSTDKSVAPVTFVNDDPTTSSSSRHAYYCFSSGTSGAPKCVITTHSNIISNIEQQVISMQDTIYTSGNVFGAVLPMSHIYGLSTFIYVLPFLGHTTVVFPKWNFEHLLTKISEHKISILHIVPPMAVEFVNSSSLISKSYPLVRTYIKGIMSGAAPLSASLSKQLVSELDCSIWQAYGLTETSPINTFPAFDLKTYDSESVGWLMPGLEARLVDTSDGTDLHGCNVAGEMWLRGPNVMTGYLKNETATAETFAPAVASSSASSATPVTAPHNQWLRTGDLALVSPNGQWYIVDRFKELIKSNGFQVAPAELESVLLSHPEVIDVAVTGIYVPEKGTEMPRAFVVLRASDPHNSARVDPLSVKHWFDSRVSKHKRLWGGLVVVDVVPKTASGKIQRRLLRDRKNDVVYGYPAVSQSKSKL